MVEAVAVDVIVAQPGEGRLDHPAAGVGMGEIHLGHGRRAEKGAVPDLRSVKEEPVAVGAGGSEAAAKERDGGGDVVADQVEQDADVAGVGLADDGRRASSPPSRGSTRVRSVAS
jgi:hypothetical protein